MPERGPAQCFASVPDECERGLGITAPEHLEVLAYEPVVVTEYGVRANDLRRAELSGRRPTLHHTLGLARRFRTKLRPT